MRIPPRPVRRILLPLEAILLLGLIVVFALGVVVGAVLAPFGSRRRPLRIAAFALAYCLMELVVLVIACGLWIRRMAGKSIRVYSEDDWMNSHQALLAKALGWVLCAAHRCVGFEVIVSDASNDDALKGVDPVLVLARHGGPGDSFVLVHLLLTRYRRRVRIVLKDILQLDPVLDVLLNRLHCCFLPSPTGAGDDLAQRLSDTARELGRDGALLLFPEGANWTPNRRRRAIRHLRDIPKPRAARAAASMTNVLPPRPGGVFACLDARPDLSVVMVAHAGIDKMVRAAQAWDELPLTAPMTVRLWPAAEIPPNADDRVAWLTTEWATLDQWIGAYHAGKLDNPRNPNAT